MRILHIISAYSNIQYPLTEDNMCEVKVRGKETRLATIDEVHENFREIPWVKGCGGIMYSYIFDTETRTETRL